MFLALCFTGCNKAPVDEVQGGKPSKENIEFGSMVLSKAFTGDATWTPDGGYSLYVNDILKDASGNETVHIDKDVVSYNAEGKTWTFDSGKKYQWTDGTHMFFGWSKKDATMTSEAFWGSEPALEGKVLTTPVKVLTTADADQFDFLYSDAVMQDAATWKTEKEKEDALSLPFNHLFSAFSLTVENLTDQPVTVKSVTMTENFRNSGSAKITFGEKVDAAVTATVPATAKPFIAVPMAADVTVASAAKFDAFAQAPLAAEGPKFYLAWPQTFDGKGQEIEIVYMRAGDKEYTTSRVSIPASAWASGTMYKYNLQIRPNTIELTFTVQPWTVVDGVEIDTSDGSINMSNVVWVNSKVGKGSEVYNTVDNSGYGSVTLYGVAEGDTVNGEAVTEAGNVPAQAFFTVNYPQTGTYKLSLIKAYGGNDADLEFFEIVPPSTYPNLPSVEKTIDGKTVKVPETIYFQVKAKNPDGKVHKAAINITITPEGGTETSAYSEIRANYTLIIPAN